MKFNIEHIEAEAMGYIVALKGADRRMKRAIRLCWYAIALNLACATFHLVMAFWIIWKHK